MSNRPIAVIGAGGHARVVLHALRSTGRRVERLTDTAPGKFPNGVDGCPVISDEELLAEFGPDLIDLAHGVGSVGPVSESHLRCRIVCRMTEAGYSFPAIIHSAAWVSEAVSVGDGTQIHAGAVIQPGVQLAEYCIINTGATVDHDCRLGAYVHVAPGVTLSGDVVVGNGSHLGTGASVIQRIRIGRKAMVAAGAVVVRDVADGEFVAGVPARTVSTPPA